MSLEGCLDCPLSLWLALAIMMIGLGIVTAGAFLSRRHNRVMRFCAGAAMALAIFWFFALSNYVMRHGIALGPETVEAHRMAGGAILVGWYGSAVLIYRRIRRYAGPEDVPADPQ